MGSFLLPTESQNVGAIPHDFVHSVHSMPSIPSDRIETQSGSWNNRRIGWHRLRMPSRALHRLLAFASVTAVALMLHACSVFVTRRLPSWPSSRRLAAGGEPEATSGGGAYTSFCEALYECQESQQSTVVVTERLAESTLRHPPLPILGEHQSILSERAANSVFERLDSTEEPAQENEKRGAKSDLGSGGHGKQLEEVQLSQTLNSGPWLGANFEDFATRAPKRHGSASSSKTKRLKASNFQSDSNIPPQSTSALSYKALRGLGGALGGVEQQQNAPEFFLGESLDSTLSCHHAVGGGWGLADPILQVPSTSELCNNFGQLGNENPRDVLEGVERLPGRSAGVSPEDPSSAKFENFALFYPKDDATAVQEWIRDVNHHMGGNGEFCRSLAGDIERLPLPVVLPGVSSSGMEAGNAPASYSLEDDSSALQQWLQEVTDHMSENSDFRSSLGQPGDGNSLGAPGEAERLPFPGNFLLAEGSSVVPEESDVFESFTAAGDAGAAQEWLQGPSSLTQRTSGFHSNLQQTVIGHPSDSSIIANAPIFPRSTEEFRLAPSLQAQVFDGTSKDAGTTLYSSDEEALDAYIEELQMSGEFEDIIPKRSVSRDDPRPFARRWLQADDDLYGKPGQSSTMTSGISGGSAIVAALQRRESMDNHPFYRLPAKSPPPGNRVFSLVLALTYNQIKSRPFRLLALVKDLLKQDSLNDSSQDALIEAAERLYGYSQNNMPVTAPRKWPYYYVEILGTIFLLVDALFCAAEVLGSNAKKELWWPHLINRVNDAVGAFRAERWLYFGKQRKNIELAKALASALDVYKNGRRPSAYTVVNLKRCLLCDPANVKFRSTSWKSWRADDLEWISSAQRRLLKRL